MQLDYRWDNDAIFPQDVFAHPVAGVFLNRAGLRHADPTNFIPAFLDARTVYAMLAMDSALHSFIYTLSVSFVPHSHTWPQAALAARSADIIEKITALAKHPAAQTWTRQTCQDLLTPIFEHARDVGLRHGRRNLTGDIVPDENRALAYLAHTDIPFNLSKGVSALTNENPTPLALTQPTKTAPALNRLCLVALLHGDPGSVLGRVQAMQPFLLQGADVLRQGGANSLDLGFDSDTVCLSYSALPYSDPGFVAALKRNPLFPNGAASLAHLGHLTVKITTPHARVPQRTRKFAMSLLECFQPAGLHDPDLAMTWPAFGALDCALRDEWVGQCALTTDPARPRRVALHSRDGAQAAIEVPDPRLPLQQAAAVLMATKSLVQALDAPLALLIDHRPVLRCTPTSEGMDVAFLDGGVPGWVRARRAQNRLAPLLDWAENGLPPSLDVQTKIKDRRLGLLNDALRAHSNNDQTKNTTQTRTIPTNGALFRALHQE